MKNFSKIFSLLIVALGFMCSANTCVESFSNNMSFGVQNNDTDSIYVWNIIAKKDFDVFNENYSVYKQPFKIIAPDGREGAFQFDYPEDLHENFKYKPSNVSEDVKINYVLILKKETFKSHTIDQLVNGQIYDAMFVLTPREIINMNYTIYYPEDSKDLETDLF